jgi:uncharacterized membrane protein YphA (DoxX/SURF4 family)
MTDDSPRSFEDRGVSAGLLLLRLGAGLSLLILFGWPKLQDAWAYAHTGKWAFVDFNRKMGLPFPLAAAVVQTLNESVGAALVACGCWSRLAAGSLALGFVAATAASLKAGEASWLLAAYFALAFTTLLMTGPGALSVDSLRDRLRRRRAPSTP